MKKLQSKDFSINTIAEKLRNPKSGAIVMFIGIVRKEPDLKALVYKAFDEMVEKKAKQLEKAVIDRFHLNDAVIIHRKGELTPGDNVVIVACSAPHRREAFRACQWLTSEMKKTLPIWKEKRRHGQNGRHRQ